MRFVITVCLVMMTAIATAKEPFTPDDARRQQWFDWATVGDVVTTVIGAGCVTVKEVNPILQGANPVSVVGFFVARNWAHRWVTENWINSKWRATWQNTWIGAQWAVVLNNVWVIGKYC